MNNTAVHEQSRQLIEQLPTSDPRCSAGGCALQDDVGSVVSDLFERLYARRPNDNEVGRSIEFLKQTEAALLDVVDLRERRLQAWAALCRTLMRE